MRVVSYVQRCLDVVMFCFCAVFVSRNDFLRLYKQKQISSSSSLMEQQQQQGNVIHNLNPDRLRGPGGFSLVVHSPQFDSERRNAQPSHTRGSSSSSNKAHSNNDNNNES